MGDAKGRRNLPGSSRSSSRSNILDAAQRVTAREGASNLTLDKVAAECGLSKGGLLYNFPNKEALLQGMLQRLMDSHREAMEAEYEKLRGSRNATLRAFLHASAFRNALDPGLGLSILAAAAQNPEFMEPLRVTVSRIHDRIMAETGDPAQALILCAAVDGLMFHSILNISPYPDSERPVLVEKLLQMAEDMP